MNEEAPKVLYVFGIAFTQICDGTSGQIKSHGLMCLYLILPNISPTQSLLLTRSRSESNRLKLFHSLHASGAMTCFGWQCDEQEPRCHIIPRYLIMCPVFALSVHF